MKKLALTFLVVMLLVCSMVLSSCGNIAGGDTTPPDGDTTPPDGDTTPPDGGTTPPDGGTTPDDPQDKDDDDDTTVTNPSVGLSFDLSDDEKSYVVTGKGSCTDSDIVIPTTHEGLPVTAIESYAFSWDDSITGIVMGNSITEIGVSVFNGCKNLKRAVLSDGLTEIPNSLFGTCYSLMEIDIPDKVTSIGDRAFMGCRSLLKVCLPSALTSVGEYAFNGCERIIEVYNPSSLVLSLGSSEYGEIALHAKKLHTSDASPSVMETVGDYIFATYDGNSYLCAYLGNDIILKFPESYKGGSYQIARRVFYQNRNIVQVTIPKAVTCIGMGAFTGCYSLVEVYNLSDIYLWAGAANPYEDDDGHVAFYAMVVHTDANAPSIIEKYEGYVFAEHENESYLVKPVTVKSEMVLPESYHGKSYKIYEHAFYDRDEITKVTLSNGVTEIGNYAFMMCGNLEEISLGNSLVKIGDHVFEDTALKSISIPDSVEHIGWETFSHIYGIEYNEYGDAYYLGNSANPYKVLVKAKSKDITSCDVHPDTKFIMYYAFDGCKSLTEVTIHEKVTMIGRYAFEGCDSLMAVHFLAPDGWRVSGRDEVYLEAPVVAVPQIAADYLREMYISSDMLRDVE